MIMTERPKYVWNKGKFATVSSSAEKFFFKNRDTFDTLDIELDDFKQSIFEKILSVSGYRTNSMNLYKDNQHSLYCFTWLLCKQYISTQLDSNKRKKDRNFSVSFLEDLFNSNGSEGHTNYEDMFASNSIDNNVYLDLFDQVPNLPIIRGQKLTYKEFLTLLMDYDIDEISSFYIDIPKSDLFSAKRELVNLIRGLYD